MDLVKAKEVSVGDTVLTKGALSSRKKVKVAEHEMSRIRLEFEGGQSAYYYNEDEEVLITLYANEAVPIQSKGEAIKPEGERQPTFEEEHDC